MAPALEIALLWLLFAGTHVGLATRRIRTTLVAQIGELGFSMVFSVVAAGAFTVLVHSYATHRFEGALGPALGNVPVLRWVLIGAVAVGVVLIVAGAHVFPNSPMTPFGEHSAYPPRGLQRITRHPFFAGVTLLGLAHALLATRLVGTVAFGGLALFACAGSWHQDRKLMKRRGRAYVDYRAVTSAVPFAAILAGRQRIAPRELPLAALAAGLVAALALRAGHANLLSHGGAWVVGVILGGAATLTLAAWWHARRTRMAISGSEGLTTCSAALVSRRQALAAAGATLLAYVGMVHEVVGDRLYPDGPALFGGPLGWHAGGLALTAIGLLTVAGTLGLMRVPVVPLALVAVGVGCIAIVGDAMVHGGFHFFAFTMVVAGLVIVATMRGSGATHATAARGKAA